MNFGKVGQKVYVKELGKRGKIAKVNSNGQVTHVNIDDDIIEVSSMVVMAWKSLSWLFRFFINLFRKRG